MNLYFPDTPPESHVQGLKSLNLQGQKEQNRDKGRLEALANFWKLESKQVVMDWFAALRQKFPRKPFWELGRTTESHQPKASSLKPQKSKKSSGLGVPETSESGVDVGTKQLLI